MKRAIALLLLSLTLVACSKKDELGGGSPAPNAHATSESARQLLAYEHQITIDTSEREVAAVYAMGLNACSAVPHAGCTVLESNLRKGRRTSASIKMRVIPGFAKTLIASLSKQGEVTSQSTTVDDLAAPIGDAKKKLDMLTSYRSKLEALQGRPNMDIDSAIKITKELAQVQSDIEALSGQQAHLLQRVQTEVLTVSIESASQRSFLGPVRASLSEFGANLSQGMASTITGIAYLLPWALALSLFAWVGRKLWRKAKRSG